MIHSLRRFDTQREIVIMTPVPENSCMSTSRSTRTCCVRYDYGPIKFQHAILTIFHNTSKTCLSMSLGGCGIGTAASYAGAQEGQPLRPAFSYTKFALWNLTAYTSSCTLTTTRW